MCGKQVFNQILNTDANKQKSVAILGDSMRSTKMDGKFLRDWNPIKKYMLCIFQVHEQSA